MSVGVERLFTDIAPKDESKVTLIVVDFLSWSYDQIVKRCI